MSINVKPGTRLLSAVCSTELIAVKAPGGEVELTIGGVPPVTATADRVGDGSVLDGFGGGSLMGKRYVDAAGQYELLCVKPGKGSLSVDGVALVVKDAKPLPSSD